MCGISTAAKAAGCGTETIKMTVRFGICLHQYGGLRGVGRRLTISAMRRSPGNSVGGASRSWSILSSTRKYFFACSRRSCCRCTVKTLTFSHLGYGVSCAPRLVVTVVPMRSVSCRAVMHSCEAMSEKVLPLLWRSVRVMRVLPVASRPCTRKACGLGVLSFGHQAGYEGV